MRLAVRESESRERRESEEFDSNKRERAAVVYLGSLLVSELHREWVELN
jgi:hypothetical protein